MSDNKGKEKYILEKHKYNNEKWKTYFFSSLAALIALLISFFEEPHYIILFVSIVFFLIVTVYTFFGWRVFNRRFYHFINHNGHTIEDTDCNAKLIYTVWDKSKKLLKYLSIIFLFLIIYFLKTDWSSNLGQEIIRLYNYFIINKIR